MDKKDYEASLNEQIQHHRIQPQELPKFELGDIYIYCKDAFATLQGFRNTLHILEQAIDHKIEYVVERNGGEFCCSCSLYHRDISAPPPSQPLEQLPLYVFLYLHITFHFRDVRQEKNRVRLDCSEIDNISAKAASNFLLSLLSSLNWVPPQLTLDGLKDYTLRAIFHKPNLDLL